MFIVGIILLWVVLLAPFALRSWRDRRSEKSIEHFHAEHEALRRRGYSVQPTRALTDDLEEESSSVRPHLHVVPDQADSRPDHELSWEEWSARHGETPDPTPVRPANPYAAYAAVPTASLTSHHDEPLTSRVSMKVRRRRFVIGLPFVAVLLSAVNLLASMAAVQDLAIVAWLLVVAYAVLALVAVALGYLEPSAFGLGRRRVASITSIATDESAIDAEDHPHYALG